MKIKDGLEAEYATYRANNMDGGYGQGIVEFHETWAALMEPQIETGAEVAAIAEKASQQANMGITGYMYGCACSALSHFWIHGDALRVWHNGQHGVGPEAKGVVNPAVITINL